MHFATMQVESEQNAVCRAFSEDLFLNLVLCHDRHAANSKSQRNDCYTEHFEGYPIIGTQGAPGDLIGPVSYTHLTLPPICSV